MVPDSQQISQNTYSKNKSEISEKLISLISHSCNGHEPEFNIMSHILSVALFPLGTIPFIDWDPAVNPAPNTGMSFFLLHILLIA